MKILFLTGLLCGVILAAECDNTTKLENALADETPTVKDEVISNIQRKEQYFDMYLNEYTDNETRNTVFQISGSFFDIDPYKPNYLLPITYDFIKHEGRQRAEVAFQISFKKDLLYDLFGFGETFSIAYTQRSWWQLYKHSSPFRETNYLPEFYVSVPWYNNKSPIKNYKFGFLHESNGQDEENSRSWNRLYMEAVLQYKGIFVNPRVWYRISEKAEDDDNSDILEYMGYGDLTFLYPYKNQLFKLLVRNNFDFHDNKGAVQVDWTFLLKSKMFGYVQYFDGYGESLIDYDKRTRRIGIGLALSR
ncbi:MAG: phospholipase A [Campylobacteraceae bacterium]|nr:phospholipase A [Campylobacteraceae bacterium]